MAFALSLLYFAPAASAADTFCLFGSGAGQCNGPQGVATDWETGRVYVADSGNNRVDVFDEAGSFLFAFGWGVKDGSPELQKCTTVTGCLPGLSGSGAGQFAGPRRIAVDNNAASTSHHDVYVGTDGFRVQKFDPEGIFILAFGSKGIGEGQLNGTSDPIAVGPSGVIYVGDSSGSLNGPIRIEEFSPAGVLLKTVVPESPQEDELAGLTVDSVGDFYAYSVKEAYVHKYNSSGKLLYTLDVGTQTRALAVDPADNLFATQREQGLEIITEYGSSGNHLRRFAYGEVDLLPSGVAPFPSVTGDVFASGAPFGAAGIPKGKVHHFAQPPSGPIVSPPSAGADPISNTKATLRAEVNPEGKASKFRFEYVDEATYQADIGTSGPGHGFDHAKSTAEGVVPSTPQDPDEFKLHVVQAEIGCADPVGEAGSGTCLIPATIYHFRVIASNADGKGNSPVESEFETRPPLEIPATWSTEVGVDAARLHAEVNPLGIPASGYFEYVSDAVYQESGFAEANRIPDPAAGEVPLDFGFGEAAVHRSVSLDSLAANTTYHYRLIADDPLIEPLAGPERTFRTQFPLQAESCENDAFRAGAGAFLPDCRAYELVSPLDKNNGDILALEEPSNRVPAAMQESSTSGDRLTYGSYRAFANPNSAPWTSQYIAQRHPLGDAEEGWQSHAISPPRTTTVFPGSLGLQLDTEFKAFSPDLCQAWLRPGANPPLAPGAIEDYANLYRRTDEECGGEAGGSFEALTTVKPPHRANGDYYPLELQGTSADGSHAIYVAPDSLTEDAPDLGPERMQLYESYEEEGERKLRFVCILPNGEASKTSCTAGVSFSILGNGREANLTNAISADGSRIFWNSVTSGTGARKGTIYVRIDGTETIPVSIEGEELSGTSDALFWGAADDGSIALFTTDDPGKGISDLYSFNVNAEESTLIAHKVVGVMGASEDASRVYFVSREALAEGAVATQANLYLYQAGAGGEKGSLDFVATLADSDVSHKPFVPVPITELPLLRIARVSPDGRHAAFVSHGSLTGYDNTDVNNGEEDAEVFLYDATANSGAGKLICTSCNPSGARPEGAKVTPFRLNVEFWVAAQIPAWEFNLYPSRVLSDDGTRLFFESFEGLVSRDTNGVQDVYQWEAPGRGSCQESSPSFSPLNGGCIALVSSGKSPRDSVFVDASPSGRDVFFSTLSRLVPQDYGLVDIYDARAGGGFPTPPAPPAACEGEACQNPITRPEDPTPASASFEGQGNVLPRHHRPRCAKGKVRRKGRCTAERHKRTRNRAKHDRRAQR